MGLNDKLKTNQFGTFLKAGGASLLHGLNHLLWPAVCTLCGGNIAKDDDGLCKECWHKLLGSVSGDYCGRCGVDVSRYALLEGGCVKCEKEEICFDQIVRGGVYRDTLTAMILSLKFGKRTEVAEALGSFLDSALAGSGLGKQIDMIVPVPLHWRRRLFRGFNQSLLIAKRLKCPAAIICTDLVRIRYTKQQPRLTNFKQRAANVAGAFAVRRGHEFAGKNICLVDDVKTSGATLNECAKTLKEAGAAKVYALVATVAHQQFN